MGRPRAGGGREQEDTDVNSYEAERNAMLEENRKRMLELGLLEAVNDVSRTAASLKPVRSYKKPQPRGPLDPIRRSSRLLNTASVSYKFKPQLARYEPRHPRYAPKLKRIPVYSGPVRRSSRLQATPAVCYKDQLDDTVVLPQWLSSDSEDDWGSL